MKGKRIRSKLLGLIVLSIFNFQFSVLLAQTDTTKVQNTKDSVEGFRFTTIDSVAITPVKNQNRSSTCWSFSTIGFLESEILRLSGKVYDLSEMFVVSHTMLDRAEYVVRMHGDAAFAPGGSAYDVIYCLKNYGMVPQSAMPGIMYGSTKADTLPVHTELDAVAEGYVKGIASNTRLKKLSPVWKKGLQAIYDAYLGACPQYFTYEGVEYTPMSFAASLGLNPDDYVSITSYTHHPFYTQFALEVPDNWRMDQMYNVPMADMMRIIDEAIKNGYTLAWGADVSEAGFTRTGIGVMPDIESTDNTGSDADHWLGLSPDEKRKELTEGPCAELTITQEMRQEAYDNWENTDDHGMQIFGTAKDQNGKRYYMVKNSWGTTKSKYKGIWYVSEAFMQYKTNDVLVHKNAIPADIRTKLGL
ncbi:MAG: aminopeptidase [Paludibacteraceae bacterium]|nr:aminopeptidase [Paludibacteraceae bacterium]MBR1716389.1 aminopeptidase [Paludibacteraceae bacterium]